MVNVWFIHTEMSTLGGQTFALNVLRSLDDRRFRKTLVLCRRAGELLAEVPAGVDILEIDHGLTAKLPKVRALARFFHFWRMVGRGRPDLLVTFTPYCDLLALTAKVLRRRPLRIVLTEHISMTTELPKSRVGWRWLYRVVFRLLHHHADRVLAVSRAIGDDLVENFGVDQQRVGLLPVFIDVAAVQRKADVPIEHPLFADDHPVVISLGRLIEQKGYRFLVEAFAFVRKEIPARLVLIGTGEEEQNLRRRVHELRLGDSVSFLGYQANPWRFLRRARVFVLSSLWEGKPQVILEAMSCGLPVVATRCPSGPEEIIADGRNGLLVPVADPEAMAQAVLRVLRDRHFASALAAEGERTAKSFDLYARIGEYEAAFLP